MVRPDASVRRLCEWHCSIEGCFELTWDEMRWLPGTVFEVDMMCAWCRKEPVTTAVRCSEDVPRAELWERVWKDCPSVRFERRYCSDEHAKAARNFNAGKASRARQSYAYTGPRGKPLMTERLACDLHADRRCWICGATDLPDPTFVDGVMHPDSWTLDHAIPIRIGGWHAPFNCEVACWRCNEARGPLRGTDLCLWYSSIGKDYGREFGSEEAARTTTRWPW